MKTQFLFNTLIFSGVLLFTVECAVNPVTGKKQVVLMSEAQEIEMGKQSDPEIVAYFGLYEDPDLQQFITEKGKQMAAISHRPQLEYQFKIVDSPVINAFAVPGGYVYFTRGIMAHFNNEAEFAGVLGHEIGHITARHSVIQQRNQILGQVGLIAGVILVPEISQFVEPLSQGMQLALLSFGRDAERQSDELGVEYSSKIGYNAAEMADFFKTLERQGAKSGASEIPEFLSTHPSPSERNVTVARLAEDWKKKLDLQNPAVNRDSYLKKIDGIVLGEDPRQGFLENNVFYHPVLKFQFPTPQGWSFQNSPQQVQMAPKSGDALMALTLAKGNSPEEATQAFIQQHKLEVVESKKETINGLPAFIAIADQKQENGSIRVVITMIQFGGNMYSFMGISELSKFQNYQNEFLATIRNFKELKDLEKLNRKPDLLRLKTLTKSMTLQAALQSFNMPKERFDELAILNGMLLTDQISAGTTIKVIGK
ncbi:M48 family metalloprotease [Algoriphagus sp. AK58]|uniref:M48 family metalloprotease n=1 Tax=Algoriphagus sp. AK58 TaxID=1406877 RepID=UPI00164FE2DB|nr:M48 family metalloprotease [Algoriphagus sp. AK58]MBC6368530.1 peptidase M48 [Algoriphagus sp. AK58]